eukprot:CAMPEP_0206443506 /NCGR_PEP_ID=MMETSP0324_2-20121206/14403_1 /ASSEMBLY_ACC=CAM_ASM_000836 /TAXON_ID=2866 /ORGANISM="Crypthecodinium cohnii, Strain Seligo" /LENGTH=352 /DNA_ID=CAMNT_0053911443 /DNA_START=65 /DNA_END=1123 /DNA_ORIENTATION=-
MGGGYKGKGKGGMKGKGGGKGKGKSGKGKSSGEAPAGKSLFDILPVETPVTALYADGEWYKAKVVQLRKKEPEVKVRFEGYESLGDYWLGPHMIKSKLLKGYPNAGTGMHPPAAAPKKSAAKTVSLPEVGSTCSVDIGLSQYQTGVVSKVDTKKEAPIKVTLDVWVLPSQLKKVTPPKASAPADKSKPAPKGKAKDEGPIPIGTQLTALGMDGVWYKAEVTGLRKNNVAPVKVRYAGCDESMDAWVALEGLRSKLLKGKKSLDDIPAEEPKKAKGKGKGKGKGKEEEESKGKGKGKGKESKGKGKGKGKMEDEKPPMRKGKGKGKEEEEPKGKGKGKGKGKSKGKGKGKGGK